MSVEMSREQKSLAGVCYWKSRILKLLISKTNVLMTWRYFSFDGVVLSKGSLRLS